MFFHCRLRLWPTHRNGDQGSDDGTPRQSASANGVPATVQQHVVRVLTASPPAIFSFAATENTASSFVSKTIAELFGFRHPQFWRRECTRRLLHAKSGILSLI